MKWIGLTGGIACGKSSVARLIQGLGIPIVDADQIVHELLGLGGDGYAPVISQFGSQIVNTDKTINKKKLASIVFQNRAGLQALENILHPLVRARVEKMRADFVRRGEEVAFYDVPLLFEKNLETEFDYVVVVSTTPELQRMRLKERDNLTDSEIEARIKNQVPLVEKEKKGDFVIMNTGTIEDLKIQLQKLLARVGYKKIPN